MFQVISDLLPGVIKLITVNTCLVKTYGIIKASHARIYELSVSKRKFGDNEMIFNLNWMEMTFIILNNRKWTFFKKGSSSLKYDNNQTKKFLKYYLDLGSTIQVICETIYLF